MFRFMSFNSVRRCVYVRNWRVSIEKKRYPKEVWWCWREYGDILTLKVHLQWKSQVHLNLKKFLKLFINISVIHSLSNWIYTSPWALIVSSAFPHNTGYFLQQKLINITKVNTRSHLYDALCVFLCIPSPCLFSFQTCPWGSP